MDVHLCICISFNECQTVKDVYRLGGVMVKASASRMEDSGLIPGLVILKTLKNGILVAVPPALWDMYQDWSVGCQYNVTW